MNGHDVIIYNRLNANAAIVAAVKGNVFPEWRDNTLPCLVYSLSVIDKSAPYIEGVNAIQFEITISSISDRYGKAVETADLVFNDLNNARWTDGSYTVLGSDFEDRDQYYTTIADSKARIAVIDLRFNVWIK